MRRISAGVILLWSLAGGVAVGAEVAVEELKLENLRLRQALFELRLENLRYQFTAARDGLENIKNELAAAEAAQAKAAKEKIK